MGLRAGPNILDKKTKPDPPDIRTPDSTALVSLYTDYAVLSPTYFERMSYNYTNLHVPEEIILIYLPVCTVHK